MNTLISVVIPVYNQERFIRECLDSLFPQCTDEVEVILVNDGSKDQSSAICKEYINRFSVNAKLIEQENSGSLKSRMNGIYQAAGEYILFMDSDDILLDDALETLLQTLHKKRYDMLLFNATCDLVTRKPHFKIPLPHEQELMGDDRYQVYRLLCGSPVLNNLWTKCIKKELFKVAAMPEDGQRLTNGEDLFQILDMADHAQSFLYLDRVLYFYRVMTDSISRVYNPNYFPSEKIVCAKRLEYAKKWGKGDELIPGARAETYKIMREIARKVLISDMPWPEIKKEMQHLRSDAFFREYYQDSKDAPDEKYRVLKMPLPVLYAARLVYKVKARIKGA